MCTTVAMSNKVFCFGRNMDIECGFGQSVVIVPRNFLLRFRKCDDVASHYSIIGMAAVNDNYPLYADAVNECGLVGAGLNFPDNAHYSDAVKSDEYNVSPFELIPFVLSKCKDLCEARSLLSRTNLVEIDFDDNLRLTELHWHFADKSGSLVFECTRQGSFVYDNPLGVLTNNPPFEYHILNYGLYCNLRVQNPDDMKKCSLTEKSTIGKGLGAFGLPGDFSSQSRFVKAAFLLENSKYEGSDVVQMFHILDSVHIVSGSIELGNGKDYYTLYSACMDADNGIYYYKSYDSPNIVGINMNDENLDSDSLLVFELKKPSLS